MPWAYFRRLREESPLYFNEQLSTGKVPYTGHPVEYPVLIGVVMQAAAWVVRPISDPFATLVAMLQPVLVEPDEALDVTG